MINVNNLKLSVYDFFNHCINNNANHKAVGVITNKQFLFYSQLEPEKSNYDWPDHWGIATLLHEEINPNNNRSFYNNGYPDDVHLFSIGNDLTIELPTSGRLSKMQADYVINILNAIEKINNEVDDRKKIIVNFFCSNKKYEHVNFGQYDLEEMKKAVLDSITQEIYIRKEEIVGKTLDEKKVVEYLKYHLDPSYCKTSRDLVLYMFKVKEYLADDYFQKFMPSIIPNYEKFISLIDIIQWVDIEIPPVTLDNLEEVLEGIILNIFNHISLENLVKLSMMSESDIKKLEEYYPNFSLVSSFINRISFDLKVGYGLTHDINLNSMLEEGLRNVTNYQDLLAFIPLVISEVIRKKEEDLASKKEFYNDQIMTKHIQEERANIDTLIGKYKELKELVNNAEIEMSTISLSLINVKDSKVKMDLLLKKSNKLDEKIKELYKLMSDVETNFTEITGLDSFYLDEDLMDYYYNRNCSNINYYENNIMETEKDIEELKGFYGIFARSISHDEAELAFAGTTK